ncbi:MAG: prenyltransferase/squalene oxidase repeat-containing protein [Bacillota bacterium]|nr:prenyltransferase/squalene oxidase repeat-containing protein [Bacillota bacterium]
MRSFQGRKPLGLVFIFVLMLQFVMVGLLGEPVLAETGTTIDEDVTCLTDYYAFKESYNDWESMGLRWLGIDPGAKYIAGDLDNPTDYARTIMGSISAGIETATIEGYISSLEGMQQEDGSFTIEGSTSLNNTIWAVIALDFAANNEFVSGYQRDKAVEYIIAQQDENGGFDESGWGVDVDGTAHALIALAPDYKADYTGVKDVVDKAMDYCYSKQLDTAAFDNYGESPDSTAAVIEALAALGINPEECWLKIGSNMVDALLAYQMENGAFNPPWDMGNVNDMTTYHALLALGDFVNGTSKYQNSCSRVVNETALRESLDKLNAYYRFEEKYDDWESLGLRIQGITTGVKYVAGALDNPTDYARTIMGSISAGIEKATVEGYISSLEGMQQDNGSFTTEGSTSLNNTIWAVIALDFAANNDFVTGYQREKAVEYIIAQQDENGGFDESGWGVDVDGTAHALIALAPDYKADYTGVKDVVRKAMDYCYSKQLDTAAFDNYGESPDSTAAVIEALAALGVNPGEYWLKNGSNMVDALLAYQLENGAFNPPWDLGNVNDMTTYHALLALSDLANGYSKYQNRLPKEASLCLIGRNASSLALDSDAVIDFSLNNTSDEACDAVAIIALYDVSDEDHMLNYTYIEKELEADEIVTIGAGLTIPETGEYEIRILVWDNWENRQVLLSPTILSVSAE